MINSIYFRCNKKIYWIKNPDNCDNIDTINTIEQENLVVYDKADIFIYEWILNKDNLSYTNDYTKNVEKYYNIAPLRGQFDIKDFNFIDQLFNTVDFNKAYTSNLQDMKYFPVFTIFDLWKKYDNHIVNDYYQYIVECKSAYNNNECQILFKKRYSRCYGYKLNRINKDYFEILQYRKPSKLN